MAIVGRGLIRGWPLLGGSYKKVAFVGRGLIRGWPLLGGVL